MPSIRQALALPAAAIVTIVCAASAHAAPRTCVSAAKGNDANFANACVCATPCRTLKAAHDSTDANGELIVLDPGDYQALVITKPISIVNDGVGDASIYVNGAFSGITVNVPNGAGMVNLRGLTIQGIGSSGGTGLRFNSGSGLTMTNCVVRNHAGNGIELFPTASSKFSVSNTLVADNGRSGILVQPAAAGTTKAAFNRVEAYNNASSGIGFSGPLNSSSMTIRATIVDSVAANNGTGFAAAPGTMTVMVVRSVVANNTYGILSESLSSYMWVGGSTITGNDTGVQVPIGQGIIYSYGDNNINGNVVDFGWFPGSAQTQ